jgi:hypothetical protein
MTLVARQLDHDAGMALARTADAADRVAGLAGAPPWLEAAATTLGRDRLVHFALHDGDRPEPCGQVTLERTRADWRSGSPGCSTLAWPFAALGYGYRPRWLDGVARPDWLTAMATACPEARIELRRTHRDVLAALPRHGERAPGLGTWCAPAAADAATWLASLQGKHRRDLHKYRRDIAAAGGIWCDDTTAAPNLLDACFRLHHARLHDKGAASAYFAAGAEQFLRTLARLTAGQGLRLSLLQIGGRYAAACLSFVHHDRYQAFVSGWDPSQRRLDLGRQVLFHQLLGELERGLVEVDFLGGDLAYKREFGLASQPTTDFVVHGSGLATLRAKAVTAALSLYRRARRRGAEVR